MIKTKLHPGVFLRRILSEHGISQSRLARHLGVQIAVINQICNQKRGISAAMAIKLSSALGTSPEFWINLQTAYDLGRAGSVPRVRPLIRAA